MQRVYALPVARNPKHPPVFVTVPVQGPLTEEHAAMLTIEPDDASAQAPSEQQDKPSSEQNRPLSQQGWFDRGMTSMMQRWEQFENVPDDDPTHWKAKLRKTVAAKDHTQHMLHSVASSHYAVAVVEIAHPSSLGPSAIQSTLHAVTNGSTDAKSATYVAAGLLPLSMAGAVVIPFFGKFLLAGALFHMFDSARSVKGLEALQALIDAGRVHFVCDPQLDALYNDNESEGPIWEVVRSEVTFKPVRVLTDDAIARLAALVGGPSGHQVGLVGSAANLLQRAKTILVGDGARRLHPKQGDTALENQLVQKDSAPHTNECCNGHNHDDDAKERV